MTNKLTTEEFIEKAKQVHGNKYDYSLVDYSLAHEKVLINCLVHGGFEQSANDHLHGCGCPKCKTDTLKKTFKKTTEQFIEEAKQVHGGKYDYSETEYVNANTHILVTCPKHGEFKVHPKSHIRGRGCKECKKQKFVPRQYQTEDIINKFKSVHGDRYDYSLVDYKGTKRKVKILCFDHGEFEQSPEAHLLGKGCASCSNAGTSNVEKDFFDFLLNIDIETYTNSKDIIHPYELDIVIPGHKLAIEFNGLYWHSEVHKDQNYHKMKTDLTEQQGYQLIHIFEDEWLEKSDLIKRMLIHKLDLGNDSVYARKCSIGRVSKPNKKQFYKQNHIQGNCNSTVDLGLYYQDELVACMSFKRIDSQGNYNLVRYATSKSVVGGFSKLLSEFQNGYKWQSIVTFADRRYSQGDLYFKNGFEFDYELNPDYYYINNRQKRFHKFGFRHKLLKQKLDYYDPNLTEHQNCYNNGYYRIYDAGKLKFRIDNPNCMP